MLTKLGLGWVNVLTCFIPKIRQVLHGLIAKVDTSSFSGDEANVIYS